ncbi:hypothetical protein DL765_007336 [Monosporascus sp. GIB2]|nr:hypothetical protein DL765_007336 [Monosporascus sp. GIB2]
MEGLFALGSNGSGQLGIGHKEDVSVPKQVLFEHDPPRADKIVKIAAGGNHTILLTKSGKAYWSGDPSTGACGIVTGANDTDSPVFREVVLSTTESSGPVADVACTWDSSVFVLRDSEGKATHVYTCGRGDKAGTEPRLVPDFPPEGTEIRDLAAGFRHVVAVLHNGDVYGFGNGRKGQLGTLSGDAADAKGIVQQPVRMQSVGFPVARAVCCQYATCLIAEPGDGRVLVLGADKWALKSSAPPAVPNWKTITAGWGGIYILKYDGMLEAWGRDDHGQLPPPSVPRIDNIAAGSEHVVAFTDRGEVVSWGWGEHGNCGPRAENSVDIKGRWSVIASLKNLPIGSEITLIGAGCATSWIHITAEGIFL